MMTSCIRRLLHADAVEQVTKCQQADEPMRQPRLGRRSPWRAVFCSLGPRPRLPGMPVPGTHRCWQQHQQRWKSRWGTAIICSGHSLGR